MSKNIDTVKAVYAAFQAGNVQDILARLSEEVDWMNYDRHRAADEGIPWYVRRRGKAEVAKFFAGLAENLTFDRVEVGPITEGENAVAVRFSYSAHYANGTRVEQQDVHWWTFDGNGKIASYRHYSDSADQIDRWRQGKAKTV